MDGYLLIDKEQDWTSSDVVCKLRGVLHEKRIGHAGTLDPMATGLVVVMIGKGCKSSAELMGHGKEYLCSLRPGTVTDTQDIWGTVLEKNEVCFTEEEFIKTLRSFTGDLEQIPPMYSAIKINGQKLYKIARKGGEVEREPRRIHIYSIDYLGRDGEDFLLDIKCSSGTYVRTLCHDIGAALGCGACMSALRRTRVGNASVEDAHKIGEVTEDMVLPLGTPLTDFI